MSAFTTRLRQQLGGKLTGSFQDSNVQKRTIVSCLALRQLSPQLLPFRGRRNFPETRRAAFLAMAHRPANIGRFVLVTMGKAGDDRYVPSSSTSALGWITKVCAARLEMSRVSVAW